MKTDEFIDNRQDLSLFSAFDDSPDFTLIADASGEIVYSNPQSLVVAGYTPSEIIKLSIDMLIPERYRAAHSNHIRTFFANPRLRPVGKNLNLSILQKNGGELPVEISLSPIATEQGELVICVIRDISNRKKIETALISDERFRLFMKHSPSALAMFDNQMRYLAVSRRWLMDYRLNDRDIIGLCHYDIFPETPERWKEIHRRCLAGETLEAEEELFPRSNGEKDWVTWKIHPWHLETGEIGGAILFTEIVTDRKKAEQALLKSEALNSSILDSMNSHIAVLDERGVIFAVNNAWRQFAKENGLTENYDNMLGVNYLDACKKALNQPYGVKANAAYTGIARVIAGKLKAFYLEYPCHASDLQCWFFLKVTPLTGTSRGVVVIHENITGRKQAEAKLNSIFNAAVDGIISYNQAGNIMSANAAVETIFGYSPEELIDCNINLLQLSDEAKLFMDICSGQIHEAEGVSKSGMVVPLDISRAEYQIDNQRFFTIIVRDISQRKQREKLDKAHLDELAHVSRLGLMAEMTSGIAHEINQPLSAICNYAQASINLINAKNADLEKLASIALKTRQLAHKAGQIIHRMREFVKSGAPRSAAVDINAIINDAASLCSDDIKQNSIELRLDLEKDPPIINADHVQIEQVLINLIRNSIDVLKSLPQSQQRQLSIQTQLTENDEMEVRVKDNGPGIDDDQQQKILTPFYTTKTSGMGMGLSICRSLIEAHNGMLRFNSKVEKGTTFYFTLPIHKASEPNDTADHLVSRKRNKLALKQSPAVSAEPLYKPEKEASRHTLEQFMEELLVLLENDRFIGDELLTRLKTLLPDEQQGEYDTLTQQILNTDYPEAQVVLNTRMGWHKERVATADQDQRPLILVVDDSRVNQESMAILLSTDYQVKVAGNGLRALEICQRPPYPDLILLDINMPQLSGYEVCRNLQENQNTCDIPVVFVTAVSDQESEIHGLQLGAVDFITKPINPSIIVQRMRNLILLKQQEKELRRIAHYDALTGIPNRVLLMDRMKRGIAQAIRQQKMLAVCYLDLDGFKLVNNTLGHQSGDEVLNVIAQRITHILRESDTAARLGGDRFVVLLPELTHREEYIDTVNRLLQAIAMPISIQDRSFSLSASVGVSLCPDDNNDPDLLLRNADKAMYTAKQSGGNRYKSYNAANTIHPVKTA